MSLYEWDAYKEMSQDDIARQLISQELEAAERRVGPTGSRGLNQARATELVWHFLLLSVVFVFPFLMALVSAYSIILIAQTLSGSNLFQHEDGAPSPAWKKNLLIVAMIVAGYALLLYPATSSIANAVLFAAFVVLRMRKKGTRENRIKILLKDAQRAPNLTFAQIVANDSYPLEGAKGKGTGWKIFAGFIAFMGVLCPFGDWTGDSAAPVEPAEKVVYEKQGEGLVLTHYKVDSDEYIVEIPADIDGIPVIAVGDRAFEEESALQTVILPDSVTSIGSYAFKNCSGLREVRMSDNVTHIGGEAFLGCTSLTEFTVPLGVTEIRGNTFQDCTALVWVELHEGIIDIHAYAFQNCVSLESIQLPSGITEIHANTFENCDSLRSVVIPEGVTRIAAHAFRDCASLSSVSVPSTVTEIGSSAFRNCDSLREITIPQNCAVDERSFKESPTTVNRR